jgi:DNA-binding MarR family transcriptional regulator
MRVMVNRQAAMTSCSRRRASRSTARCSRSWSVSTSTGPVGVGELADRAGRDHTTVSRQVARLADLGLIDRRPSPIDRRVHEAVITGEGRQVIAALDAARQRLNTPVFSEWRDHDLLTLERLLRRYVDDLHAMAVP